MTDSSLPRLTDPAAVAQQLLQRAHNRDGLPEIAIGTLFLLTAALEYAQTILPRRSLGFDAAVIAFATGIPAAMFATPRLIRWARHRYLLDRVGYMQPKPVDRKQLMPAIVAALLMAAVIFLAVHFDLFNDRWILAGTGLFGGLLLTISGRRRRFTIGGILMAAAGVAIGFANVSLEQGFALLFGFTGVLAATSGFIVLRRFLREPL